MRTRTWWAVLLMVAVACGSATSEPSPADPATVVATTDIVGALVAPVLGSDGTVEVLLAGDPHDADVSAAAATRAQTADLVVAVGLGLEAGLVDLLDRLRGGGVPVLELAPLLDPLPLASTGAPDPHFWLDPLRAAEAVHRIAEALAERLPDRADVLRARAEAYAQRITTVHEDIAARLAAVPAERRRVVVTHDGLGYFAARYDLEVVGIIEPGGPPDAAHLTRLVEQARAAGVRVVVVEGTVDTPVATRVAQQIGATVVTVPGDRLPTAPGRYGDPYLDLLESVATALLEGFEVGP